MRCVACGASCLSLFTIYSANNYVLKECDTCRALLDPYIELEFSQKLMDMLLLKKPVFRHLMFNASHEEAVPGSLKGKSKDDGSNAPSVWRLALALVLLEGCELFLCFLEHAFCFAEIPLCSTRFPMVTGHTVEEAARAV